ncbi:MAG: hypothetical protein KGL40_01775 [Rhodocyclaceae bacterium]|nr:hypothetical protein [Rhodocyclaceae bacterium]
MRMRPAFPALIGMLLCSAALSGFAQTSAAPSAPPASTAKPPPTPSRAPLGAPPPISDADVVNAYAFRNNMSSDPVCQDLARQADSAYADGQMDSDQKQKALAQIRSRAAAAGCL